VTTTPRPVRPALLGEVAVVVLLVGVYDRIRDVAATRADLAMSNAARLLDVERWLHLDVEHVLNDWLARHSLLEWLASWYYQLMHLSVTLAVLVLLYWRRPSVYRSARTSLIGINVLGLLVFWLVPLAPPRMFAGFVDSQVVTGVAQHAADLAPNVYAAMPSLHVGWATWVVLQVWAATSSRPARLAVAVHLGLTVLVVVATANHFTLDVVAGSSVALLSTRLARAPAVAAPDRELVAA
jgi:PAP2 superfamily